MNSRLGHRGPDDSGVWVDQDAGIALGHRRLSILDISSEGSQPMASASGRYVIAFNGEIYNHPQIRKELEQSGHNFRGRSDTEVMLAAIEQWGVKKALEKFAGMFAFALWDKRECTLYLARDRLGEKPLYYGWMGKALLFASELEALHEHPCFRDEINHDALALYLRYGYVPHPWSIYRDVYKLPPGAILEVGIDGAEADSAPFYYWSARKVAEQGAGNPLQCSADEAVERLDGLLRESVHQQMVADVPLGAFLSGGIDSSTVVALMQAQSASRVKTFSIGFHEGNYNEAHHAKAVARHLDTDHTELYVTPEQAMDVIPRLPRIYSEPFSDSSQIPTFLVSQLAGRYVKVALSGDGGDELFAGYNRYFMGQSIWRKVGWMPLPVRRGAAHALKAVRPGQWEKAAALFSPLLKGYGESGSLGDKFHKLADVLAMPNPDALYYRLISLWTHPEALLLRGKETRIPVTDRMQWPHLPHYTQRMMFLDLISFLPDDILTKVDRASMSVSLEARVPLLDHRVVEFAWSLPMSMKIREGQGKWILRQVLDKYVPRTLIERPKMGFGVPIGDWLRSPLRDWAEELLSEGRLRREGFFDPAPIRQKWEEHLAGRRNWQYLLWDILMFQAWNQKWKG